MVDVVKLAKATDFAASDITARDGGARWYFMVPRAGGGVRLVEAEAAGDDVLLLPQRSSAHRALLQALGQDVAEPPQ